MKRSHVLGFLKRELGGLKKTRKLKPLLLLPFYLVLPEVSRASWRSDCRYLFFQNHYPYRNPIFNKHSKPLQAPFHPDRFQILILFQALSEFESLLSPSTVRILQEAQITSLADLIEKKEEDLEKIPNINSESIKRIKALFFSFQLPLGKTIDRENLKKQLPLVNKIFKNIRGRDVIIPDKTPTSI